MSHILKENGVLNISDVQFQRAQSIYHIENIYRLIDENKVDENGRFRLLPLTRVEIAQILDKFYVVEVTRMPIVCGSVVDYEWDGKWVVEVRSVAVDKNFRGQGLGTKVIGYCKERAGEMLKPDGTHYSEVYATINKSAPEAIAAFEKNGFEFVADRPITKIMRDCMGCPLYNNGCNEATYAAKIVTPQPVLSTPGSYRSSQNGSAYSGLPTLRTVQ